MHVGTRINICIIHCTDCTTIWRSKECQAKGVTCTRFLGLGGMEKVSHVMALGPVQLASKKAWVSLHAADK